MNDMDNLTHLVNRYQHELRENNQDGFFEEICKNGVNNKFHDFIEAQRMVFQINSRQWRSVNENLVYGCKYYDTYANSSIKIAPKLKVLYRYTALSSYVSPKLKRKLNKFLKEMFP